MMLGGFPRDEVMNWVCDVAVQVFGPTAFTRHCPIVPNAVFARTLHLRLQFQETSQFLDVMVVIGHARILLKSFLFLGITGRNKRCLCINC
jgi:hypothetical protein